MSKPKKQEADIPEVKAGQEPVNPASETAADAKAGLNPEPKPPAPKDTPPVPKTKKASFRHKRASEVFDTHTVEEVFFTEDDECFVNQQFAVLHAQGLSNPTVTPVQRKEIE